MANIDTVYSETETQTAMDDTSLNPVTDEVDGEVQITLSFRGVDHDPGALFDALQNLGTVATDKLPTRNNYNFIVSA